MIDILIYLYCILFGYLFYKLFLHFMNSKELKVHFFIIQLLFFIIPFIFAYFFVRGDDGGIEWFKFIFSLFYGGIPGFIIGGLFGDLDGNISIIYGTCFNIILVFLLIIKVKDIFWSYIISFLSIFLTLFLGYGLFGALMGI